MTSEAREERLRDARVAAKLCCSSCRLMESELARLEAENAVFKAFWDAYEEWGLCDHGPYDPEDPHCDACYKALNDATDAVDAALAQDAQPVAAKEG